MYEKPDKDKDGGGKPFRLTTETPRALECAGRGSYEGRMEGRRKCDMSAWAQESEDYENSTSSGICAVASAVVEAMTMRSGSSVRWLFTEIVIVVITTTWW
jgi:hypothetical protein